MTTTMERLSSEARSLAPLEKLELVESILASLDPVDPNLDALWLAEIKDRLAAYQRGEMTARDADDVFAEYARK